MCPKSITSTSQTCHITINPSCRSCDWSKVNDWRRRMCSRSRAPPSSSTGTTRQLANWNWRHLGHCFAAFFLNASSCCPCASSISDCLFARRPSVSTVSAWHSRPWFLTYAKRRWFTPFTGPSSTSPVVRNSATPSPKSNCPFLQRSPYLTSEPKSGVIVVAIIILVGGTWIVLSWFSPHSLNYSSCWWFSRFMLTRFSCVLLTSRDHISTVWTTSCVIMELCILHTIVRSITT